MKICTKCNQSKDPTEFFKDKSRPSGLEHRCKLCSIAKRLQWAKNNPQGACAHTAKRRAYKLKATPYWVDLRAIHAIYQGCPEGYQVDHIVPLKGKTVSGLHVPWNLQYLTTAENRKKSNKFI